MNSEFKATTYSGYPIIPVLSLTAITCVILIFVAPIPLKIVAGLCFAVTLACVFGFYMVGPNEGKVLQLFGKYTGTDNTPGLRWANPLYTKQRVSLRVRNFESGQIKVNDLNGNPIEIATVVVWKVVDTAEAIFEVDDYEGYVAIQSEAALRNMATSYPYDSHNEEPISLRGNGNDIADILKTEVENRLQKAGVAVIETRLSHLAYAPEIASAMLQRQQASAIVAARHKIVEGAVGMVEAALEKLAEKQIIELDEERKATMVGNLMVVLCGDKATQPIVNTGSLY